VQQGNILFLSTKLQRILKNNAMPRVYPYGIVLNTILHSIIIHSIGLNMKHTATQLISSTASAYGIHPSILIEDDGFVSLLKNLLKENASWMLKH